MALRYQRLFDKSCQLFVGRPRSHRNISSQISNGYRNTLVRYPYVVQGVQAGLLMAAGDLISQVFIEKQKYNSIDAVRTLKFASVGLIFVGPVLRFWYGQLDRLIRVPSKPLRIVQKVACDQLLFAPPFIGCLVSIIGFSQTPDVEYVGKKLQNEYIDILKANYMLWPWVQLVNFGFIPLNYQVLLAQMVAVTWNVYLSWKTKVMPEEDGKSLMEQNSVGI